MSETVEELQAQVRLLQEQEAQLAQRDAATQAQIQELQGPSPAQEQAALVEDVSGSASTPEEPYYAPETAFVEVVKPYREHGRLGEEGGV